VARQYTGTAGRVENAQVAVHLTWATSKGAAFIDAELYLPEEWTNDPARMKSAGVPDDVVFATKPALAVNMIKKSLAAGIRPSRVTGDSVYGRSPRLREFLQSENLPYVLEIACDDVVATGGSTVQAQRFAASHSAVFHRISAGAGTTGPREFDWAFLDLRPPENAPGQFTLAVRRAITPKSPKKKPKQRRRTRSTAWSTKQRPTTKTTPKPTAQNTSLSTPPEYETRYFLAWSPNPTPMADLVHTAGTRWRIEECFQHGKELAGLDEHQVLRWQSWHRWVLLSMLALAFLSVVNAINHPPRDGLAALTRNEIRRILTRLAWKITHTKAFTVAWVNWRLRRRHAATISHLKRANANNQPP